MVPRRQMLRLPCVQLDSASPHTASNEDGTPDRGPWPCAAKPAVTYMESRFPTRCTKKATRPRSRACSGATSSLDKQSHGCGLPSEISEEKCTGAGFRRQLRRTMASSFLDNMAVSWGFPNSGALGCSSGFPLVEYPAFADKSIGRARIWIWSDFWRPGRCQKLKGRV
jgi:hypothetical protein